MRITLLTHSNLYDSKRYFSQSLAKALERAGIEIQIVDDTSSEFQEELVKIACNPSLTDFTGSFNSQIPTKEGKFLCDFTGIPHIFFNVDPLFYSRDTLKSDSMFVACVDHFDCEYAHSRGFKNVFFLGHGVDKEISYEPNQERPYDVVFIGSCYDHETFRQYWRQNLPALQVKMIENAIDIVLSDNKTPIFSAVEIVLKEMSINPIDDDQIVALAYYVDNYIRGKDRVELIRSIKTAHVHVFGDTAHWRHEEPILDWSHSLAEMKNVTLHPAVSMEQSFSIIKQSKICLNSMPFFKNGTHERIFSGLACGSLPITTDNLWIRDHFKHGQEILIYRSNHWEEVDVMVNTFLNHEARREEIVQKGREIVMKNHTWDERAQELLKNWEKLKINF